MEWITRLFRANGFPFEPLYARVCGVSSVPSLSQTPLSHNTGPIRFSSGHCQEINCYALAFASFTLAIACRSANYAN
jgi:hypothetical protein